jgi:hypothetical protein
MAWRRTFTLAALAALAGAAGTLWLPRPASKPAGTTSVALSDVPHLSACKFERRGLRPGTGGSASPRRR